MLLNSKIRNFRYPIQKSESRNIRYLDSWFFRVLPSLLVCSENCDLCVSSTLDWCCDSERIKRTALIIWYIDVSWSIPVKCCSFLAMLQEKMHTWHIVEPEFFTSLLRESSLITTSYTDTVSAGRKVRMAVSTISLFHGERERVSRLTRLWDGPYSHPHAFLISPIRDGASV
jgi:hypothetical protein